MWLKTDDSFDSSAWNVFVAQHGPASGRFLQSWEWGEFQKALGQDVERWTDVGVGVATIINQPTPGFGSYVYCPRGPVVNSDFEQSVAALAIQFPRALFFRCDPPAPVTSKRGWQKTISIQPEQTWMTDLTLPQEQLFAAMHKKTRYNVGVGERAQIEIRLESRDLEAVWPLFEQTASRGQFRLHHKAHYQKLLSTVPFSFFATAWRDGRPIAANVMIDFAGTRTYLHGASSYEHRALMAPHLLHWELMKDAQAKGLTAYDWWGVAPVDQPDHSWAGISRFKRSFPGQDLVCGGTYDLVQKPFWYKVYALARRLRRAM